MDDISVRGIYKSFDQVYALKNFSARFACGETTCVMGRSGCGKTTLLNIIMGFIQPDEGTVDGVPERISAVFQEDRLLERFSVMKNLTFVSPRAPAALITEHLDEVGLSNSLYQPVFELSGGMRRRVAIVRAVLAGGDLLVLDEPFKGLDETTRLSVARYIKRRTAGTTVIMVTHDPEEVSIMGGHLIEMYPPLQ